MKPYRLPFHRDPQALVDRMLASGRHGDRLNPSGPLIWAMMLADRATASDADKRGNAEPEPEPMPIAEDPTATARIRWHAYLEEMGDRNPPMPIRLDRAELHEYLEVAWPEVLTDRRQRKLVFEIQGIGKEVTTDLAGETPTGYWLASHVDAKCAEELHKQLGGTQTSLF